MIKLEVRSYDESPLIIKVNSYLAKGVQQELNLKIDQ